MFSPFYLLPLVASCIPPTYLSIIFGLCTLVIAVSDDSVGEWCHLGHAVALAAVIMCGNSVLIIAALDVNGPVDDK